MYTRPCSMQWKYNLNQHYHFCDCFESINLLVSARCVLWRWCAMCASVQHTSILRIEHTQSQMMCVPQSVYIYIEPHHITIETHCEHSDRANCSGQSNIYTWKLWKDNLTPLLVSPPSTCSYCWLKLHHPYPITVSPLHNLFKCFNSVPMFMFYANWVEQLCFHSNEQIRGDGKRGNMAWSPSA